jgi:hypothetical protein
MPASQHNLQHDLGMWFTILPQRLERVVVAVQQHLAVTLRSRLPDTNKWFQNGCVLLGVGPRSSLPGATTIQQSIPLQLKVPPSQQRESQP